MSLSSSDNLYFDNNATTRPCDAATSAMLAGATELWHNPSSVHKPGQAARHAVEVARGHVASLLGARPKDCTFLSSGTEALDLAIRGTLALARKGALPTLLTTRVEHAAIRELAEQLEKDGSARVLWLPLKEGGVLDVPASRELVRKLHHDVPDAARSTCLLALQWANNETGAVQPVREASAFAKQIGATFLVDGTQWVGKLPTQLEPTEQGVHASASKNTPPLDMSTQHWCDMLVCSAHKFHGVKGCGILWARQGLRLRPTLVGTQELGRRGGTENVPAIIAAGAAAQHAQGFVHDADAIAHLSQLRDEFEQGIVGVLEQIAPHLSVRINKPASAWLLDAGVRVPSRLWNTTNIAFATLEAEALLIALSERGVAASAGAACSSGSLEPSPVLLAMGIEPQFAHGSIRLSLSRETTLDEVEEGLSRITAVVKRVAASM